MSVLRFEPLRDPFERLISMAATGTRAPLGMPMDVYRAEDGSYHVEADLPGVDPDSIEVTVETGTLTIRAERTPHYGQSEQVIAAERPQGSFTRLLTLGEGVDAVSPPATPTASLNVTIPASPRAQARRVEVTRWSGGSRTISGGAAGQDEAPAGGAGGGAGECPVPVSGQPATSRVRCWPPGRPAGAGRVPGRPCSAGSTLTCGGRRAGRAPGGHFAVPAQRASTTGRSMSSPAAGTKKGGTAQVIAGESRSDDRVAGEPPCPAMQAPTKQDAPPGPTAMPSHMGHSKSRSAARQRRPRAEENGDRRGSLHPRLAGACRPPLANRSGRPAGSRASLCATAPRIYPPPGAEPAAARHQGETR